MTIPGTDELAAAMRALAANTHDKEKAHIAADNLMVKLLRDLGYGEAIDVYEGMDRWCA